MLSLLGKNRKLGLYMNDISTISTVFSVIILIMSVVIHELCHGYAADLMGDPTPRLQGRLTLNPFKHLDPVGSFIVPVITSLSGFTFGWAKPVEWNPYNVKNKRLGEFVIALAGPASNILIAVVFGLLIRAQVFGASFVQLAAYIVLVNLILAVFNLIPVPPLDGSKVLFSFFPQTQAFQNFRYKFESYGLILIFVVAFFLWQFVAPIVTPLFRLIVGV